LTVDGAGGDGALVLSDGVTFQAFEVNNCSGLGLNVNGATDFTLADGEVKSNGGVGVQLKDCDEVAVRGLDVENNTNEEFRIQESDGGVHSNFVVNGFRQVSGSVKAVNVITNTGSVEDVSIDGFSIASGALDTDGGTRVFVNGTQFISAAPTAADYSADHIGKKIVDTSASPPDVYYVDGAGSLTSAT
jgi:hypothetical protein